MGVEVSHGPRFLTCLRHTRDVKSISTAYRRHQQSSSQQPSTQLTSCIRASTQPNNTRALTTSKQRLMPSTHRRRDSTVEFSRVGGVYWIRIIIVGDGLDESEQILRRNSTSRLLCEFSTHPQRIHDGFGQRIEKRTCWEFIQSSWLQNNGNLNTWSRLPTGE